MLYDTIEESSDSCDSENTESGFSDTDDGLDDDKEGVGPPSAPKSQLGAGTGGVRERRRSWRFHQRTLRRRARLHMQIQKTDEALSQAQPIGSAGDEQPPSSGSEGQASEKKLKQRPRKKRSKKGKRDKKRGKSSRRSHFRYYLAGQLDDNTIQQISHLLDPPSRRRSRSRAGSQRTPRGRSPSSRSRTGSGAALPSSETPSNILEISLGDSDDGGQAPQPCEECEATPADVLCHPCQAGFCAACFQRTHSSKVFRRHLTRQISVHP